jgi:tetrahydrodipicolinate N-succinyltransferase
MLASQVYITDSDWHGIYDRSRTPGTTHQVVLEKNVWVGDSAIICKDVTIGENSIIGAGSVVVTDIPPNVMAGGNPARVIKKLDPKRKMITRKDRYANVMEMVRNLEAEKESLKGNTLWGWVKSLFFPPKQC